MAISERDWNRLVQSGLEAHRQGRHAVAEQAYREALGHRPGEPRVLEMLAVLVDQQGRHDEALGHLTEVVRQRPSQGMGHARLGGVLEALGRDDEAIAAYRQALALFPEDHEAMETLLNQLGQACFRRGRLREALGGYEALSRLRPGRPEPWFNRGNLLRRLGRMEEAVAAYRAALQLRPCWLEAHEALLFTLAYFVLEPPEATLDAHRAWAACLDASPLPQAQGRPRRKRLRIGYVSNTFRRHVANFFFAPAFEAHDHEAFEIACYAHVERPDRVTRRFMERADLWRDITGLDDAAAARLIAEDAVDILVDLDGHTAGNRLGIFAWRPAPVQVTYLGYCTTTGLAQMDYWLTDAVVTPADTVERTTERIWRLPRCWVCYGPSPAAPEVHLPDHGEAVVFGSLNELSKLGEPVVDAWAGILEAVPAARLLLKTERLVHDEARADVVDAFARRGIPADRLELRPRSEDYLPTYDEIDIALDPFPRTGGVTTADALWMGVPVVTLAGRRMIERQGASLLTAAGLESLIAETVDDYIRIAIELARDEARRRALRDGMRARLRSSGLLSGADMARRLEEAYRGIWRQRVDHDDA